MNVIRSESYPVTNATEVVQIRQHVRKWAVELGFSLIDQTKIVTAASELARNMVDYGKGGTVTLDALDDQNRKGLRVRFDDNGPGIASIEQALKDGFTTGGGMGLGLGGAKRLANEFDIRSAPGEGTHVVITRWRGVA